MSFLDRRDVKLVLDELIEIQQSLTDAERLELWDEIRADYCDDCGRELKKDEKCFCTRDD